MIIFVLVEDNQSRIIILWITKICQIWNYCQVSSIWNERYWLLRGVANGFACVKILLKNSSSYWNMLSAGVATNTGTIHIIVSVFVSALSTFTKYYNMTTMPCPYALFNWNFWMNSRLIELYSSGFILI